MVFEWDEDKRLSNIEKHKLDFVLVQLLFDGRSIHTTLSGYPHEERWLTTGIIDELYYTVIWTQRGPAIRFISARRARDAEERAHRQIYG